VPFARITRASLLVGTALAGPVIVTRSTVLAGVSYPSSGRISRTSLVSALAYPGQMRITYFSGIRAQSIHRAFYPERLESDSVIYDFEPWEIKLLAGPFPEFNPYKPAIPEKIIDVNQEIYDYLKEKQETLREQHNKLNGGDTNFPWQMVQVPHDNRFLRLGSVSRFWHEQFGIIEMRYVQYDSINPLTDTACPMGLLAQPGEHDWVVTNRIEQSHPFLLVGLHAGTILPKDGQYGWIIVDGCNLQEIRNASDDWEIGEALSWHSDGYVSNDVSGIILGRRILQTTTNRILPGEMHVRLESMTAKAILESLGDLTSVIAELQEDVDALQTLLNAGQTIQAIQSSLAALQQRLTLEEQARRAADVTIQNLIANINAVTATDLANAITNLQNEIATVQGILQAQISAANNTALDALDKANQALAINISGLQDQINQILTLLTEEIARPKGKFPVVDGSVPPNLVYMDDGSLVYTETF
jgi:hypothetical protein